MANHDKFLKTGQEGWADRLKRYSEEGKLDRQRLLDASLDALDKDFAQYRAGWYSRFHVQMAPSAEEMAARSGRYLRLLSSSIPPTVSFALKHVQTLDKAGALDTGAMFAALEPALQARAKGTVMATLKLLQNAAKRQPDLQAEAARKAALSLISEDAGVQGKALDVIEKLGADAVTAELADYVDLVAPSVRPRLAKMAGVTADAPPDATPDAAPVAARPVTPVATAEDALALFLKVLEDPRDPIEVEKAIDGVSRFGAVLRSGDQVLSPLRKRAKQVCNNPGDSDIRFVLAMTGRALAEGVALTAILAEESGDRDDFAFVGELSLQEAHLNRNVAVLTRLRDGLGLPMVSLPSDTSGALTCADLLGRLALYRKADVTPDPVDLALALMRLAPTDREFKDLPTTSEADRAVAYALGAKTKVGPTPELWAAAWRARVPEQADSEIGALFKKPTPNCGAPAVMTLMVNKKVDGPHQWIDVDVPVIPLNQTKSRALPALFGLSHKSYDRGISTGHTFADVAWASLARPSDPEPFFRLALPDQDTWQKLADNYTRAYLEPFFRPGPQVGALGAGVLAYYMACEDKSVSSLAVEAAVAVASDGRLTPELFASALTPFLMSGTLPTARWTKALSSMAKLGAGVFAREVITGLLTFAPNATPRDIGGMLELCFELHLAQSARLTSAPAIACLQAIPGGGKTAKFSKKLLNLAD